MTKFFFNSKSTLGLIMAPFPNFFGKKVFPKNPALSRTMLKEFLAPCQNSKKSNDPIPRKHLDSRKKGRTDFIS